jgi:hypothetical protein
MITSILLVVAGLIVLSLASCYVVRRILRGTPRHPGNSVAAFWAGNFFSVGSTSNQTPEEQARRFEEWRDQFAYAPFPRKLLFVTLCSANFTLMFVLFSKLQPVPFYLDTTTPLILLVICLVWGITLFVLSLGRKLDPLSYELTPASTVAWWACFALELVVMLAVVFRV